MDRIMDKLTIFGLFAVTAMLVTYALEKRSHWFILAFAGSCILGSAYGFLQGAWPFGLVEAIWSLVAIRGGGSKRLAYQIGSSIQRSSMVISIEKEAYVDRRCIDGTTTR